MRRTLTLSIASAWLLAAGSSGCVTAADEDVGGTWTDAATGLAWAGAPGPARPWHEAREACATLRRSQDAAAWRLPRASEFVQATLSPEGTYDESGLARALDADLSLGSWPRFAMAWTADAAADLAGNRHVAILRGGAAPLLVALASDSEQLVLCVRELPGKAPARAAHAPWRDLFVRAMAPVAAPSVIAADAGLVLQGLDAELAQRVLDRYVQTVRLVSGSGASVRWSVAGRDAARNRLMAAIARLERGAPHTIATEGAASPDEILGLRFEIVPPDVAH